jgi:hypothetical protein
MDPLVEAHMEARALPLQQNFFQAQVQDLTKEFSNLQGAHNCKIDQDTTPEEAFFNADMTTAHLMRFQNI